MSFRYTERLISEIAGIRNPFDNSWYGDNFKNGIKINIYLIPFLFGLTNLTTILIIS